MLSVSKHIVENGMHNNMNNRVTLSLVLCQYLRFLISISKITTSTSFLVTPYTREFLIYWYRYDINAKFIFCFCPFLLLCNFKSEYHFKKQLSNKYDVTKKRFFIITYSFLRLSSLLKITNQKYQIHGFRQCGICQCKIV